MNDNQQIAYKLTELNSVYNVTIDDEKLKKLLSSNLSLNPYIQSHIKSYISGKIIENGNISEFFKNVVFLDYGGSGEVFLVNDTYIIKNQKYMDPEGKYFITNEIIIGLKYLNNVRNYIPNFAYTYGYVRFNNEHAKFNNKYTKFNNKTEDDFLIVENILNSSKLYVFVDNNDIDILNIYKCYVQIFNALNVAYQLYEYTHGDLNYGNILVRKFDKDVKVNIYGDNMEIIGELTTQYVPYIIDYGDSKIFSKSIKNDIESIYQIRDIKRNDFNSFIKKYRNYVKTHNRSYTDIIYYMIDQYNIPIDYTKEVKYINYSFDQFKEIITQY